MGKSTEPKLKTIITWLRTSCYTFFLSKYFIQLDAQNLFHNKFYFIPLHVSSTCAHHQEVKTPIGVMIPEAV